MRHLQLIILCSSALLSAFTLSAPAQAACDQWDMPAKMSLSQNSGTSTEVELTPSEGGFTGTASYSWYNHEYDRTYVRSGVVDGTFDGASINFTIHWEVEIQGLGTSVNSTGVYTGTVGPQGRMTGTTYDADHPEVTATWFAREALQCHAPAAPPRSAPAPVTLGRVQPPPGSTPSPPQTICERARAARERNSPTASMLEARCAAEPLKNSAAKPEKLEIKPPQHLEVIPH